MSDTTGIVGVSYAIVVIVRFTTIWKTIIISICIVIISFAAVTLIIDTIIACITSGKTSLNYSLADSR